MSTSAGKTDRRKIGAKMINTKKLTVIFSCVFAALLAIYLIVFFTLRNKDYTPDPTPVDYDKDAGESIYANNATMYKYMSQNEINSITVRHTEGEKTSIYRIIKVGGTWYVQVYLGEISGYEEAIAAGTDSWDPLLLMNPDGQHLAEIRVATGVSYYRDKVTLPDDYTDADLAKYGIDRNNGEWYEIDGEVDGERIKKKVYIGSYNAAAGRYYLNIDGTNRVYLSGTDLSSVKKGAEYFITADLFDKTEKYASYYVNDFSLLRRSRLLFGGTDESPNYVREGDIVSISFYILADGETEVNDETTYGEMLVDTSDPYQLAALKEFLLGKRIAKKEADGTQEILYTTVVYPKTFGEKIYNTGKFNYSNRQAFYYGLVGYKTIEGKESYQGEYIDQRVRYAIKINSVIRSEEEFVKIGWLNAKDRDPIYRYTTYKTYGSKSDYRVNTDNFFTIANLLESPAGSETVALKLTEEEIEKYGLDAYTLYYKMPYGVEYESGSGDEMNMCVYMYKENVLMVSEKQKDGSRYVGSWYSGKVVKVADSDFDFLDWDFFEYVEPGINNAALKFADSLEFDFNYRDKGPETFRFRYIHTFADEKKNSYTTSVREEISGKDIDSSNHANFYTYFVSMKYLGTCALTEAETAALIADDANRILTVTLTLNAYAGEGHEGETSTYRIYPYSTEKYPQGRAVAVGDDGIAFDIELPSIEKLYRDCHRLTAGETVDSDERY